MTFAVGPGLQEMGSVRLPPAPAPSILLAVAGASYMLYLASRIARASTSRMLGMTPP